ncbi:ras small monomeric GTPase RasB [Apiospora kogelbergensis]|uniref:small monomeric GTPase n=1 Tax=Apiospora kogelbergensis TaxID=1337665 RepID=A0AAW0R2J7_9PEZI
MLIGNKKDLNGKREVSAQNGLALADELGCKFIETSAKYNEAVEGVFHDSIKMLNGNYAETSEKDYEAVGVFDDSIEIPNGNCGRKSIWDYWPHI